MRCPPPPCCLPLWAQVRAFWRLPSWRASGGIDNPVYHHKSLYYLGGLTEGSETIALFVLMCLWPAAFAPLAYGFALLCLITTLTRLWSGYHTLRHPPALNRAALTGELIHRSMNWR